MPYFTKKGIGTDKGKTCVYKKSSKKKVGCTAGPVEKYLTALRMAESNDMDWIKDAGQNKILTINKLKEVFNKNNVDVDWDIEYDRTEDGHGDYNEYFGKFYYDRENHISHNESYFIELYEKENGQLFFYLYRYDEEDDKYYRDEVYSQIETSSKDPEKFWRTVGWLVLYQMGKIKPGNGEETFDVENTVNESEDLSWIENIPSNEIVRPWNGTIGSWTTPIYDRVYLYTDDEGVTREVKVGGLTSKYRKRNRKGEWFGSDGDIRFYDASISDEEIKTFNNDPEYPDPFEGKYEITMSRREYNNNASKGKLILTPNKVGINENDELDWIRSVEPDFNSTTLRYGQIFKNKWGDYIRTIMFIGQDDEEVSYEKPMTLLTFKIVDDPSGYKAYPDFPKDHELNSELSLNPKDFDEGIKSGRYKPMFTDKDFKLKESSDFDWIKDVEATPNYQGHPQGVVYLKTHKEIEEFFDLLSIYGMVGKRKTDIENTKRDFHNALDGTIDRIESDEWDGYDDWVPVISASFFISKKDPTKYITGYWDFDVDKESVDDWIKGDCEDESIDCNNWRLYKDISEIKELFNYYYTPQSLHKTKSGKPIKVGDKVKEIPGTKEYGQRYRYFEILACYGIDWETDECGDVYSHFIRIPIEEVDEIWDIPDDDFDDFDYLAGPGDEGEGVIMYVVRNRLISANDLNEIIMYEGVREIGYDEYIDKVGEPDERINESGADEFDDQELFSTVVDHDVIVINGDKYITNNINESDDWGWAREIPGTEEYGQDYRYFEVNVCYTAFYNDDTGEDDCFEGSSYFFKIPKSVVPEIWDYEAEDDKVAGPDDEGEAVIEWAIENDIIDPNDVDMFEFVTEHDKKTWCVAWGNYSDKKECIEFINESDDFDWVRSQEPEKEIRKSKKYVVDVSHLRPAPMKHSHDPSLTKQDILRKLEEIGYDVDHIDVDRAKYFYVEPTEGAPSWQYNEYGVPIEFDYWVDYNTDLMDDPSYGGKYQTIDVDEFMFLIDNNMISESRKPINEVAGISFEARKWAEIIYNEIISNPEEKTRLIIDGYDYPEVFNSFPIDYVVVDFYDRLTGYGQEHSGYDKDGNYVVLLYVQPKLVSGQGGYSLQSALNHEMKHAWEDYNRLSKGLPSIEQTKESQELYNRDYILMLSDQNVRGPIKEILKYYYYLSNLEKSAYLENVYDQNPAYERVVRDIASKDFESFKDRFDLDVNWHLMNTAYNIPFLKKFKSPREFIDYSAEELRSRALKMIKKINKMRYVHGKM